jgi:hypothetical protein
MQQPKVETQSENPTQSEIAKRNKVEQVEQSGNTKGNMQSHP